jgi:hypothetical protein
VKRNRLLIALAVSSAGALAACNFIVDAGDYKVGGGGSGSDASSPGDSSMMGVDSGSLDTSMPMADSPINDSGTSGGDTGTPVNDTGSPMEAAVTCGSGLPTTSAAFQNIVKSCAMAVGCAPGGFIVDMSDCISEDFLHSINEFSCLLGITTCAQYESCQGAANPTTTQCPTTHQAPFCTDAGVGINCGGSLYTSIALDCNVLGGTCAVYNTDAGSAADCKVVSSCSQTDPSQQYCSASGNNLYSCIDGAGYGQNCGANSTCIVDPTNGPDCYFNTTSCNYTGVDTYTCNGNTVDYCTEVDNVGELFPFNCSTAGLTCNSNSDDNGNAGCLAPGCTPNDLLDCTESCSGTMANVCVGGAQYSIDCSTIGPFTTCATLTDSGGNSYIACQ